jgi:cytosine deaminase
MDLILRNATLPDGRKLQDIAVEGGRIVEVAPAIAAKAAREIDAAGRLVTPPFVDSHFHMDATLSYGIPRINASGTLFEGIALWGELKPLLTHEAVIGAGPPLLRLGGRPRHPRHPLPRRRLRRPPARGRGASRGEEEGRPYLDLQLVAFPQDGLYKSPNALRNLERALDLGVDVVGGIPHFEKTTEEGTRSVKVLCQIAAERGLRVDMHCDETDDPMSRHIETLARETRRLGLQGRVVGSHLTSMHSMDNAYADALIPLIRDCGVSAIANPLINIVIQGRYDTYPKRRGLTRVPELLAAGVPVAFGQDCVLDPWYSLGSADMLDVAHMGIHVAQMTSPPAMLQAFTRGHRDPGPDHGPRGLRPGEGLQRRLRPPGRREPHRGDPPACRPPRGRAPRGRRRRECAP